MLTTIQRSALVTWSARDMFALVNDVESYPAYMEGCSAAEILEEGEDFMIARLDLRKGGISYSFSTRNELVPHEEIRLSLHSGPLRKLSGAWRFKPLTEQACKVSLHLEFEANSQLVGIAASSLFASVANNLVSALTERAATVYGSSHVRES